jgi:hypothetical protein
VRRLVIRRHRHSLEVASEVGADWAERKEPQNWLVPASDAENEAVLGAATTQLLGRTPGTAWRDAVDAVG